MQPVYFELDPSLVLYANVDSDGVVTIPNNNSPVLVATIPLTTGPMPLSSSHLCAMPLYSYTSCSNDGSECDWVRDAHFIALSGGTNFGYRGGSPPVTAGDHVVMLAPSTYVARGATGANSSGGTQFGVHATMTESINGSGDLEVSIAVKVSAGQAWKFKHFTAKAIIFGGL